MGISVAQHLEIWNLTSLNEKIYDIINRTCHYCGHKPTGEDRDLTPLTLSYTDCYNGIDRKDNSLGYQTDNVVPCCAICNRAKNNMDYKDFIDYLVRISNFRKVTCPS